MPSRVIGSTRPAASPTSAQRGPASATASKSLALSDGIGHEYGCEPRAVRDPCRGNPPRRPRAERLGGHARIGLRADADRQMRGARKRPDVAGRIGRQLDDDLVARDAVREEPGGDRELIAAERRRDAAPHQAVRAVGADHERRRGGRRRSSRASRRRRRPSPAVTRDLSSTAPARSAAARSAASKVARSATRSALPALAPRSSSATTADRRSPDSVKRAERMTDAGQSAASMASATSASARPVTPPPHGFSRGCDASTIVTRAPRAQARTPPTPPPVPRRRSRRHHASSSIPT